MFALKRACPDCPFRKDGGIRLTRGRTIEVAGYFITGQGGTFPCHRTVKDDDEDDDQPRPISPDWQLCAGGMIFADKVGRSSAMMQLGIRLGLMKLDQLEDRDGIVDSLKELLALSWDRNQTNKRT